MDKYREHTGEDKCSERVTEEREGEREREGALWVYIWGEDNTYRERQRKCVRETETGADSDNRDWPIHILTAIWADSESDFAAETQTEKERQMKRERER